MEMINLNMPDLNKPTEQQCGLSWLEATKRLRDAINEEVEKRRLKPLTIIQRSFSHCICLTSLCYALAGYLIVGVLVFFVSSAFEIKFADDEHVIVFGFVLLFLLIFAIALSVYTTYLKESEIIRKTRLLIKEIDNLIDENGENNSVGNCSMSSPNLYAPPADNIALQWTYRDNVVVNLPWILLVEGDVLLLRSGREAPARCRRMSSTKSSVDDKASHNNEYFEMGQIYLPENVNICPGAIGVQPYEPLLCIVTETPAVRYLRTCLNAADRPASLLENEYRRIVHIFLERFVVPACMAFSVFVATVSYVFTEMSDGSWYEMLILRPFLVVLPILSPVVSIFTFVLHLFNTAVLLNEFSSCKDFTSNSGQNHDQQTKSDINRSFQQGASNLDLFTEQITGKTVERCTNFMQKCQSVISGMVDLAMGECSNLMFSANIVFSLGNLTSLSVIDKKGILSWPNPSPEKVFFFSPSRDSRSRHPPYVREQSASTCSLYSTPTNMNQQNYEPSSTPPAMFILNDSGGDCPVDSKATLSNATTGAVRASPTFRRKALKSTPPSTSKVNSEVLDLTHDPNREFVVHFDDSHWSQFSSNLKPLGLNILLNGCALQSDYVRFMDHVFAVSHVVPRTIAVVNRRCLCNFAKAIGFRPTSASAQFERKTLLAAYKRASGEIPLPGMTKHKTPLPCIFCTVVKDKLSDHKQVMCQGTAELILEACDYYWDGRSVKRLSPPHRKKINDFSSRHNMTSYCIAFSYRPLSNDINEELSKFYIDWPLDYCKSTSSSTDSLFFEPESHPPLAVSFDSLLMNDYYSSTPISNTNDCLKYVLKGQVFLGVISLQYQAKLDVVRLVDNLDKACIRFVHYSKENELRSRVFAEKCGLEAGWNCHISLARDEQPTVSHHGSSNVNRTEDSYSNVSTKLATCSSNNKNRQQQQHHRNASAAAAVNRCLSINAACSLSKNAPASQSSVSLPKDLKLDLPVVHFKSTAETPMDDLPRVIFTAISYEEYDEQDDHKIRDQESVFGDNEGGPSSPTIATSERTPMLSETTSRTSLVTNHSSTAGLSASAAFFMTNRAQLPKGIENVRPHLRDVDNVPLLVPLFTDCYPEAIREMIEIMQENGEVVCVLGSTLNYRNAEIFCQANASVGVEPAQPSICVHDDSASSYDSSTYNSIWLANSISGLPCSLCIGSGERINLLNLIALSRHLLITTRMCMVFYLNCSLLLTCLQFLNQLTLAPPTFTVGALIYLLMVVIPLLSLCLCAAPRDDDAAVKFATPKNESSKMAVKMFLLGFLIKFLPTAIICALLYKVTLIVLCWEHDDASNMALRFYCSTPTAVVNVTTMPILTSSSVNYVRGIGKSTVRAVQNVFVVFILIYICAISMGYVQYKQSLRARHPFTNRLWTFVVIFLVFIQILYTLISILTSGEKETPLKFDDIPWYIYLIAFLWIFLLVIINELWKLYEIRIWLREQRRRRLLYQTKLGMNSPF